jgi:DeoR/GlpR family transcriptional regulator of sugar metabolism
MEEMGLGGDALQAYLITSAGAIEPDGTLLNFYDAELAVVSAMRERARMHLVAPDHTKFGRSARQRLCRLRDILVLFTDREPPASIREVAAQAGVSVVVADDPSQSG